MNNRTLGTIAVLCAPALLADAVITAGEYRPVVIGTASMVFMAGWACSNTVMRREGLAGTGPWGRAVLGIQLVGLAMAFLFGLVEASGVLGSDTVAFTVLDISWPLSMLWSLVVGAAVIAAGRLARWRRFVPALCVPVWLVAMTIGTFLLPEPAGVVAGQVVGAVMWGLLGLVVRDGARSAEGREAGVALEPLVP